MANRYGLEIRGATAADAGGLAELMALGGLTVPSSALGSRIEAVRQGGGTVLIADEWGPPSGVLALTWFATLEAALTVAQITTLFVAPDERRRGIARLLLKTGSQAARSAGCGELRLPIPLSDEGLRGFCDATGFVERDRAAHAAAGRCRLMDEVMTPQTSTAASRGITNSG